MTTHSALAAAATLVAVAFAMSTFERWLVRRRPYLAAWSVSLAMFAAGSAALWAGASLGWDPVSYRAFYLFGAILNVPFLALGTIYLLGDRRRAHWYAAGISLLGAFAVGVLVTAPLAGPLPADELPRGSEVFGALPRILAGVGSGAGALVVFGGAGLSAWRALRGAERGPRTSRVAAGNSLIALGTVVLSLGGLLNSVVDEMVGFSITLVVGIVAIFAGFLVVSPPLAPPQTPPRMREWLDMLDEEPISTS